MIDHDIGATKKLQKWFGKAEEMLSDSTPFSESKWYEMMKYLKTTHLFGKPNLSTD